ncbi:response regulator transcription factor [Pseudomonas akapageensis]|uniref:response regulator transcription factor n=1 Tax=Pseudomonas akapageensis TaxID=2609961 RepID=UPI00140A4F89|nr:helix-turn-helix transcriptional regulator [Pseudomonas akapageensis]
MEMHLTVQEVRVLSLIAQGLTDREIAARLSVAFSTARKHRENLLRKLQAKKSTALVAHHFALMQFQSERRLPR